MQHMHARRWQWLRQPASALCLPDSQLLHCACPTLVITHDGLHSTAVAAVLPLQMRTGKPKEMAYERS
jgi:hypothetical protein